MVQCCHIVLLDSKEIIKRKVSAERIRRFFFCSFGKLVKVCMEETPVAQVSQTPICAQYSFILARREAQSRKLHMGK